MNVDRVLLAEPRGFSAGVEMAIKPLASMVRSFEPPVYCYHEIVHNKLVVDRFRDQGVVFVDDIAEVLEETGLSPELLELEITESTFIHDVDTAAEKIAAIASETLRKPSARISSHGQVRQKQRDLGKQG